MQEINCNTDIGLWDFVLLLLLFCYFFPMCKRNDAHSLLDFIISDMLI